jgi:hypothetical protein
LGIEEFRECGIRFSWARDVEYQQADQNNQGECKIARGSFYPF